MYVGSFRLDLTVLFGLCNRMRGIPEMPNPIRCRFMGLNMLFVGLHLAFLCQNCRGSIIQIDVPDELKLINFCQHFVTLVAT